SGPHPPPRSAAEESPEDGDADEAQVEGVEGTGQERRRVPQGGEGHRDEENEGHEPGDRGADASHGTSSWSTSPWTAWAARSFRGAGRAATVDPRSRSYRPSRSMPREESAW